VNNAGWGANMRLGRATISSTFSPGASMSEDTASPLLPLSGVRVIDVATMLAAPFCATMLGEFGAEVTKIEMPGDGDGFRRFGTMTDFGSFNWLNENRNKRSITLDLRKPEGAQIFKRLVSECDILVENFRPGTLEKWGLGYETLKGLKPDLIMIRVTAYGQTGPNRNRPGFARLAHAFSGFADLTGERDGPPLMPGSLSLGDYVAGLYATIGALLAFTSRNRHGVGQSVDVSLYESLFRLMDEMASVYDKTGYVRERMGADVVHVVPHSHYRCQDGKWIALACSSDKMFERLALVMNKPELLDEEQFRTMDQRLKGRAEVNAIVASWVGSMPREEVLRRGLAGGVALSEVYDIADIFADPHYQARQTLTQVEDPRVGTMVVPNVFPVLSATPGSIRSLGPDLGHHNLEVYRDQLGMSEVEIERLRRINVI
jgi:crotonobetainyl-CoA:carnitine CoA-transferase CaiB-like acyl-CoA transferase